MTPGALEGWAVPAPLVHESLMTVIRVCYRLCRQDKDLDIKSCKT